MTYLHAATRARDVLEAAGISPDYARRDADLLARHAAGWDLAAWLARRQEDATPEFLASFETLVSRRARREPVAYIRGVQEFWGREFRVGPGVLIPRPETELLVETALAYLAAHPGATVVDVGTGSGCIAVTLALECPDASVHAVEVSEVALDAARDNAARLGAPVHLRLGSFLADTPRPIDLIVSNPPYVAERDKRGLGAEVRDHEPDVALFGGQDGWGAIRQLLRETGAALAPQGRLMMEMGYGQSEDLAQELAVVPELALETIVPDLAGIPRVAVIKHATAAGDAASE